MSAKSKNTSAKLDRPFDPELLARARGIAKGYQMVLWAEDGEYFGRGLEMPGVMADGKTRTACIDATLEALAFAVATLLEQGQTPPPAAMEGHRTEQVNIRLTIEERLQLEAAAKQQGFRGLADYLRAAGMAAGRMSTRPLFDRD